MEVDHHVKESLGIESLLDDSLGGQDVATSKLSDAAALAESFQPKGNTLESTKVQPSTISVSTLYILDDGKFHWFQTLVSGSRVLVGRVIATP